MTPTAKRDEIKMKWPMMFEVHPSHKNLAIGRDGRVFSLRKGCFIEPYLLGEGSGYYAVTISHGSRKERKTRTRVLRVHSLVLETFVGPRPRGYHAAHLNGNSRDNRLENLAWVTPHENNQHKILHGTSGRGEKNARAILTEGLVRELRERFKDRTPSKPNGLKEFCDCYGISRTAAQYALSRRTWKHLK